MPSPSLIRSTRTLHRATAAAFGETTLRPGGTYAWFPAAAGGTTYTVPLPGTVAPARRRGVVVQGLSSIETGEIAVHCLLADLPFTPVPHTTIFIVAPAEEGTDGTLQPSADFQRYVVSDITPRHTGAASIRFTGTLST